MAGADMRDASRDTEPKAFADATKAAIIDLMTNFSIELTPRELASVGRIADHVPLGTRVYITWLSGADYQETVRAAKVLRGQGMAPVPHLAARAVQDEAHLDTILRTLREDADVRDALIIGGSLKRPVGCFDRTIQLLETGLFAKYGITSVGVAGHPEGSPDIPSSELDAAVRLKNAFARSASSHIHFTTQFCFEANSIIDWERKIRRAGNQLDIHVGLAGLASLSTLIKHARNCGVGPSIGVLTRRAGSLFKLSAAATPARIVLELARSRLRDGASSLRRCHFFPFGSFTATAAWATAISTGDFVTDEDGGIRVNRQPASD